MVVQVFHNFRTTTPIVAQVFLNLLEACCHFTRKIIFYLNIFFVKNNCICDYVLQIVSPVIMVMLFSYIGKDIGNTSVMLL